MEQDVIAQYIIIKSSLQMSVGKIVAQAAHGSMMCAEEYRVELWKNEINNSPMTKEIQNYHIWLEHDYRKVVLRADDKEFEKLKLLSEQHFLVIDNGLTQFDNVKTETVICFMPMYKSKCPKLIKRLQVLK